MRNEDIAGRSWAGARENKIELCHSLGSGKGRSRHDVIIAAFFPVMLRGDDLVLDPPAYLLAFLVVETGLDLAGTPDPARFGLQVGSHLLLFVSSMFTSGVSWMCANLRSVFTIGVESDNQVTCRALSWESLLHGLSPHEHIPTTTHRDIQLPLLLLRPI